MAGVARVWVGTRRAWRRSGQAALAVALLAVTVLAAGCGGSDAADGATPPDSPVAVADQSADAVVGPAGGRLQAASAGVLLVVDVPPDAVTTPTRFALTPAVAADGAAVAFRVLPSNRVFAQPLTVKLTFPQGTDLRATRLRLGSGDSRFSVAALADTTQRTLSARISRWAGLTTATTASAALVRAQAAGHPDAAAADVPPDGGELLTAAHRQTLQAQVDEARTRLAALQRDRNFEAAYALQNSVAQLLMMRGEDGYAASAVPFIDGAHTTACQALAQAIGDGQATQLTAPGQYVAIVRPILYWEAAAQRLGGDACPGTPYQDAIAAVLARERVLLQSRLAAAGTPDAVSQAVDDVAKARDLKVEANALQESAPPTPEGGTSPLPALLLGPFASALQTAVIDPALAPARQAAWDARIETGSHRHYLDLQRAFGLLPALENDVQYGATQLVATAQNAQGQAQRILNLGIDPNARAPADAVRSGSLGLPADGRLAWSGRIATLTCPTTAQEQLVIALDGVELHRQDSGGANLLSRSLALPSFTTAQLVAAIQASANDTQPHTLTVRRLSSCLATFGITDDVLFRVTLLFNAPEPAIKPFEACFFVQGGVLPVFPERADFITIGPLTSQGRQFNVINLGEQYRSEFNVAKYQTYILTDGLAFTRSGTPYAFDFRFSLDDRGRRRVTGTVTVFFPTSGNPASQVAYDAVCDQDLGR